MTNDELKDQIYKEVQKIFDLTFHYNDDTCEIRIGTRNSARAILTLLHDNQG